MCEFPDLVSQAKWIQATDGTDKVIKPIQNLVMVMQDGKIYKNTSP
jgi:hypothetical protein